MNERLAVLAVVLAVLLTVTLTVSLTVFLTVFLTVTLTNFALEVLTKVAAPHETQHASRLHFMSWSSNSMSTDQRTMNMT